MKFRRVELSFGFSRNRVWSEAPMEAMRAPWAFAFRTNLLYREVWWRLLMFAALTFCLNWFEGRVNACICRRSASGTVHHGGRRVEFLGPVASVGVGVVWLAVYMTQNGGRGVVAPISTRRVCFGGSLPKSVTASVAAASARSLPLICVCALIFAGMWSSLFLGETRVGVRCFAVGSCDGGSGALPTCPVCGCVGELPVNWIRSL